jgi:ammonia channel protein AmtB
MKKSVGWITLICSISSPSFASDELTNGVNVVMKNYLDRFVGTLMHWLIDRTVGLRASPQQAQRGLDLSEHIEVGYPGFTLQLSIRLSVPASWGCAHE